MLARLPHAVAPPRERRARRPALRRSCTHTVVVAVCRGPAESRISCDSERRYIRRSICSVGAQDYSVGSSSSVKRGTPIGSDRRATGNGAERTRAAPSACEVEGVHRLGSLGCHPPAGWSHRAVGASSGRAADGYAHEVVIVTNTLATPRLRPAARVDGGEDRK